MSWDPGTPSQRRPSRTVVVAGCVLAIVALGFAARQPAPSDDFTVTKVTPPTAAPSPSPSARPSRRPRPSPSETVRAQLDPPLPGSGLTLSSITMSGRLVEVDLDTGELVEVDAFDVELDQVQLLPDGAGGLVVLGYQYAGPPSGRAWHITSIDVPPVEFAAGEQLLASATPGRVWLLDDAANIRELDVRGTVTAEVVLPAGIHPVGAVEGGLLVDAAGTLVHVDARSGRGSRIGDGQLLTADAEHLARRVCDETLECWIAVGTSGDADAGRVAVAPDLSLLTYNTAALSPNRRWLAGVVYEPMAEDSRVEGPAVILVDLTTGEVRRPPEGFVIGVNQLGPHGPFVWDPSGRWLFAPVAQAIVAWDVQENSIIIIDVGLGTAGFVVQEDRSG